jgi:hypothetical protein
LSALQNGGITYGIIPSALTGRHAENAVVKSRGGDDGRVKGAISKEGTGDDLLEGDYEGRMRTEVVGSMHEVSLGLSLLFILRLCTLGEQRS